MRVLWWPIFTFPGKIDADSSYIIFRNALRLVDWGHHYLIVPDGRVSEDDLDTNPRVTKFRVRMSDLYHHQEAYPDEWTMRYFSPTDGTVPVDCVVSGSPQVTLKLAHAWGIRGGRTAQPVYVNWDLLVRDDHKGELEATEVELLQAAAGCAVADLNIFESDIARRMALDVCRSNLAAGKARRVAEGSVDIPQGIPVQRIRDTIKDVPKREKFTVYYGGRFSTSKRVDELAEVVDAFYRFGRDVQFVITTGSLASYKRSPFLKKFPEVELHVGLSQDEAWKVMASCHASICFSRHELFGMAYWEQMFAGLAVVMKAEQWNSKLVPPNYDLLVRDGPHAAAMLRHLHETWLTDLKGWGWKTNPAWSDWVAANYDADQNLSRLLSTIHARIVVEHKDVFEAYRGGNQNSLALLASQVLREGITWTEYIAGLRKLSRTGTRAVGHTEQWWRSIQMLDCYRMAKYLGYDDVGGPEPVWSLGLS